MNRKLFGLIVISLVGIVRFHAAAEEVVIPNLALAADATLSGSVPGSQSIRGVPLDIVYDPVTENYATTSDYAEYGAGWQENIGLVAESNPILWQVDWTTPKDVNYITIGGAFSNQPQANTAWKVQYQQGGSWLTLDSGIGGWINAGIFEWGGRSQTPLQMEAFRVIFYSGNGQDIVSFHLRGRGGQSNFNDDRSTATKALLLQNLPLQNLVTMEHDVIVQSDGTTADAFTLDGDPSNELEVDFQVLDSGAFWSGEGAAIDGTTGLPSGAGNRLLWLPDSGSLAAGSETSALGDLSMAFGQQTTAGDSTDPGAGVASFATGINTTAKGDASATFGEATLAEGVASFAAGHQTTARGDQSVTLGSNTETTALATDAAAMGSDASADAEAAFSAGLDTQANTFGGFNFGRNNTGLTQQADSASQWYPNDSILEIGIGEATPGQNINALTVQKNGRSIFANRYWDALNPSATPADPDATTAVDESSGGVALRVEGHAKLAGNAAIGGIADFSGGSLLLPQSATGIIGAIRWTGTDFEGYDGAVWKSLTEQLPANSEEDPIFSTSVAALIEQLQINAWNLGFQDEQDPEFNGTPADSIGSEDIVRWDSMVNQPDDPSFPNSVANSITQPMIDDWNIDDTGTDLHSKLVNSNDGADVVLVDANGNTSIPLAIIYHIVPQGTDLPMGKYGSL